MNRGARMARLDRASRRKVNCVIRDSCEEDVTLVQSIYRHHVLYGTSSFEEVPPSVDELKVRRTDVLEQGLPYLVAELNGDIAGYAYASPYRSRSAYRFTIENSVYVDHRLRRRGIGRALLAALVTRCSKDNWQQMIGVIGDSNNVASITLHQRCGFVRAGVLRAVGFKFGRWIDTILMQRALGPEAAPDILAYDLKGCSQDREEPLG